MAFVKRIREPDHIGHFRAVFGIDRALGKNFTRLGSTKKFPDDAALPKRMLVGCGTHDDLTESIQLDLVGQIFEFWTLAYLLPVHLLV